MAVHRRSRIATEAALIGERSAAVALWAALRTEQRRGVERTAVSFSRCGWHDEAAEPARDDRRR